ncbi:amidase family protein [Parafrankia sp. FMc2]|uniref:amidase family protein n=1 Tax=Parafrankia sp. FMc2 TaxID=3233196 RepID=UPI0034D518D7
MTGVQLELHEYARLDAVGLSVLVRGGELRPENVEELARRAIEQVAPDLNALTGPLFDQPLASDLGGPLAGVPFLIKDSGPFARGVAFTLGSRAIRGAVAGHDHDMMARFRAAGLMAPGQTTTPDVLEAAPSLDAEKQRPGPPRRRRRPASGDPGRSAGSSSTTTCW